MTRAERIKIGELHEQVQRIHAECQARMRERAQLARDLLFFAASGGMPDTYWQTDSKVGRACKALGWTREQGRRYARRRWDKS